MMNEFGLLFNVIKNKVGKIQEEMVGTMMKVFQSKTIYSKVAENYKDLPFLFPDYKLDKRLESYIVSFVDQKSLKSMILVSKAWFLRACLLKYMVLKCEMKESSVSKMWLWQACVTEEIESETAHFKKECEKMELTRELSLPECKISLEIVNEDALDQSILFLEKDQKLYERIAKLDCKFFDITHKNYKKFEGLLNKLPELVELNLGKFAVGDEIVNLNHGKIEIFEIYTLSSKKEIKLEMKKLKTLRIHEILGESNVEAKAEFNMPCLEACSIIKISRITGDLNFTELSKCSIDLVEDSTLLIVAQKMKDFKLEKVMQCFITLKHFPIAVIDQIESIIKWKHQSSIEVIKLEN